MSKPTTASRQVAQDMKTVIDKEKEEQATNTAVTPKPPQSMKAILACIPEHCLRPNTLRAVGTIVLVVLQVAVSIAFAAYVWQFESAMLWLVSWLISGTTLTSVFVLAHDCAHYAFFRRKWMNVWLGHIAMVPVLYPFYAWKYAHDAHHTYTNQLNDTHDLYGENTWLLETVDQYNGSPDAAPMPRWLYWISRVMIIVGPVLYLFRFLLQARRFRPTHRRKVIRSYLFMALFVPALAAVVYFSSGSQWLALLHFWLLPSLVMQAWLVVYTYVQHVAVELGYYQPSEWTPFRARAMSTLNVYMPRIIGFLHLNLHLHLAHHLEARIPCYHLPEANVAVLRSPYGAYVTEMRFSFAYLYRQWRACKLWDVTNQRYASFADARRAR